MNDFILTKKNAFLQIIIRFSSHTDLQQNITFIIVFSNFLNIISWILKFFCILEILTNKIIQKVTKCWIQDIVQEFHPIETQNQTCNNLNFWVCAFDEKIQQNALKFAIFYIYINTKLLFPFFIFRYFNFFSNECLGLCWYRPGCFVVFFHEWNEWKYPQFNFSCQNLSIECNIFKWNGKVTKVQDITPTFP